LALSSINDGLWDWNPKTGEVYFSSRWKSMLGYRDEEIGATVDEWIQRVHPDDIEATMAEVQRHLRGETEYYQSEHRLRCKDGGYKWILDRGRAYIDMQGNPVRMLGAHSDISERREAQTRERMHAEQLAAIFEFSPDGYVTFDSNRNVKYVSPAFTSLTGLAASDFQGVSEVIFSEKLAEVCLVTARFQGIASMRGISDAFDSNGAVQGDRSYGKEDHGTRQVIELANIANRVLEVALRETQSDHVSQILHLRDISYETEVDRLKTEFLSTAAHELRTPMASIYGFSEVLLKQEVSQSERQEFLGIIHRQSELMGGILNELLDLARIEARQGKDFTIETVEVQSLVGEVVSNFKLPAKRSLAQISAPAVALYIRADRKKAAQAILNVISNAYKYSHLGEEVQITIVQVGKNVTICVIDQGIGMTSEQVRHVGERFYRANMSGSVSGTGLGMSIVAEIMRMHAGSVSIQSTPGKGSAFTLTFPL
jgi:PAS domain S-box-containing protein